MINVSQKYIILLIAVLSFFTALLYNEINLNYTREDAGSGLRYNETIACSDDVSYITPPENYLKNGVWKDNAPGRQSYFMRPPGYGLFYMIFLSFADPPFSLKLLKYCQLLLFALSVYCFFFITNFLIKNFRFSVIITILYGLSPFAAGFLYSTMTESITPALVIFYVYFLLAAYRSERKNRKFILYIISSLVFAYIFITRPVLGILGIMMPFFLFRDYCRKGKIPVFISSLLVCGIISVSIMVLWLFRSYSITGRYVGLHPVYYAENNSEFRPTHKQIWEFAKGWGEEGAVFHGYILPLWKNTMKGDTSDIYIKNIIDAIPQYVKDHFGKERLTEAFMLYRRSIFHQKMFYDMGKAMPC